MFFFFLKGTVRRSPSLLLLESLTPLTPQVLSRLEARHTPSKPTAHFYQSFNCHCHFLPGRCTFIFPLLGLLLSLFLNFPWDFVLCRSF